MKYIKKFNESFASKLVGAAALTAGLMNGDKALSQTKPNIEMTDTSKSDWGKNTEENMIEVNKIIKTATSNSILEAPVYKGYDIEESYGVDEYLSEEKISGIIILKDTNRSWTDVVYIFSGHTGNPTGKPLKKIYMTENTYIPSSDLPETFTIFRNGGTGYKFKKLTKDSVNNRIQTK